ncbi:hypothetical protein H0H92_002796 [Tricholoma furcatifolium]|nr:hypothetical protein H0H92_002796 [Tricholoma furcatifolium]
MQGSQARDGLMLLAVVVKSTDGGNAAILKLGVEDQRIGESGQVKWAPWALAMLDIAFREETLELDAWDVRGNGDEFGKPRDVKAAGNHRYISDIIGNGWSSRFKHLITSRSLIFKTAIFNTNYIGDPLICIRYGYMFKPVRGLMNVTR